ncbi:uncharacterized protein LOC129599724 [Paramacrobiotus metropolitanus]|uniref:uncharacterized protein LOC129599724 n=1 Tax=Paramacrobiotus metropolitanus TaxID=2943436 RepID=UPI0024461D49|nr:uncharacterized protein LOC129599724 [Paramacrobiotus metropolitanus]
MSGTRVAHEHRMAVRHAELKRKVEQRRMTRDKTAELDSVVKARQAKEVEEALEKIRTDVYNCGVLGCRRCRPPKQVARMSTKPSAKAPRSASPAPVLEVLTHKMEKDVVWMWCKPATAKAHPDYRRQCQVPAPLREAYVQKLQKLQRIPTEAEGWTVEDESNLRAAIHPHMSAKQIRQNRELQQFQDTAQWDADTKNGKVAGKKRKAPKDDNKTGPALNENGNQYYEIESILGAVMNQGKKYYLVKWVGWTPENNSWEEETAFAGSNHLQEEFFQKYGKVTWRNPRVMSPEGEAHEAWLVKLEKTEYADSKQGAAKAGEAEPASESSQSGEEPSSGSQTSQGSQEGEEEAASSPVRPHQGPLKRDGEGEELYEVERIVGALLQSGPGRNNKMWVLIKWRGWELAECTWQKATTLKEAAWALNNFYADYGKPTQMSPKILAPEGRHFEDMQAAAGAAQRAKTGGQVGRPRKRTKQD